jgi:hypothetical protein
LRLPYFAVIGALVVLAAAVGALVDRGGGDAAPRVPIPTPPGKAGEGVKAVPDPFAYDPRRRAEFEQRAAAGNAHVLYSHSPGGATATAERVARWRPQVESAAGAAGVDADMVEALVFLESAGREDAVTPGGLEGAAGLTQILAETATNLLGLKVDVARSARYRRRIDRAFRRGDLIRVQRLRAARARVDERFDPAKALAATGRYLKLGMDRFGVQELALVSYHMGMGNLEGVLAAYGGGARVPYAQVYFDSSPLRHPEAHAKLAALGDDSSNYLWKLHAARDVMRLYRSEPEKLAETQALQTAKNSAEELLHPSGTEKVFATSADLRAAYDAGDVVALPDDPPKTGLRVDRRMGELVPAGDRKLYRGLRSPALALALYIGAQTRAMAGDAASTLTVSSTVRDERYQRLLIRRNREATRNYSLHTTGWAFDVLRRYRSRTHALAFQFVLDRLQSLNLIAWVREPGAIHITAARDAEALAPLLEAIQRGG